MSPPPRVFISYSRDSPEHDARVLDLAERLREDAIDAVVDQYNPWPSEGWPAWCQQQITAADFVLMVCTETYHRRVEGGEEPGKGLGVVWEAQIIRQLVYDSGAVNAKFIPVLFPGGLADHIPLPVKRWTRYVVDTDVDTDVGYDALYRHLTSQPWVTPKPLGQGRKMPSRPARTLGGRKPSGAEMATVTPRECANWAKLLNREAQETKINQRLHDVRRKFGRFQPLLVVLPCCARDCHDVFVERYGWHDLRPYCQPLARSAAPVWRAEATSVYHLLLDLRAELDLVAAPDLAAVEEGLQRIAQSLCFSFRIDDAHWRMNAALVGKWIDYFCHQWPAPEDDQVIVVSFLCVELPEKCGGLAGLLTRLRSRASGSLASYLDALQLRSKSEPRLLVTAPLEPIRRSHVTDWIGKVRSHLRPDEADELRERCRGLFPEPSAQRSFAEVHSEIREILQEITGAHQATGVFAR